MSETFKSFSSYPVAILSTDGEILDLEKELAEWKKDLNEVTELAEWNEVKNTQCSVGGQKTRYFSVATDGGAKHTTSMTERQHKTYSTDKPVPVANGRICQ